MLRRTRFLLVVLTTMSVGGAAAAAKPPTSPSATKAPTTKQAKKPGVGLTEEAEAGIAQAEALLLAGLQQPSTLKRHLADRHAVEGYVWSTGVNKADEAKLIAGVLEEQKLVAPPPSPPFAPDRCFSMASLGANERVVLTTEEMVFFEGDARTATMFWVQVQPDKRTLLLGPPVVDAARAGAMERWLDKARTGDATMYVKQGGAWVNTTPPAKSAATCSERLKAAAKQLYAAEVAARGETDTFSSDLGAVGFVAPDGISATVKLATDTAFVAELTLQGGVVTVDDQLAITMLKPCAP